MALTLGLVIASIDAASVSDYNDKEVKFSGIQNLKTLPSPEPKSLEIPKVEKQPPSWVWPFQTVEITSWYGPRNLDGFHYGIDFAANDDVPIAAITGGTVVFTGWNIGNEIRIQKDNYTFVYGHLNSISVGVGQEISPGQIIGLNGSTGFSLGPHLHLEIWENGIQVDPYPILTSNI